MKKKLLDLLACPVCQKNLKVVGSDLVCRSCRRKYPVEKNLPLFLPRTVLTTRKRKEIEVFDDLKAYRELMARPYFRTLKSEISRKLRAYHLRGKTILEIGAGTSLFLEIFSKTNRLVALDINQTLLEKNRSKAELVVADAENLPFKDNCFDFVYLVGVLHHLDDQKKALAEIKRVVKDSGRVFISEPTRGSLNLVYYLTRRVLLKLLGVKTLKKVIGCGTPDESFVDLKSVKKVLGESFNLEFERILPLRWPPIRFLEKFDLSRANCFLAKVPLVRSLGTIVFIQAQPESDRSVRRNLSVGEVVSPGVSGLGFGTDYEIYIFKKIAKRLIRQLKLTSVKNWPKNDLLGGQKIFGIAETSPKPDLIWNFCEFENVVDPRKMIEKMGQYSGKYLLVVTQNYLNPGVVLHWLFHRFSGKKWDHGDLSRMSARSVRRQVRKMPGLEVVETGAFDIPWFVLDVYETGRFFRRLPFLRGKAGKVTESRFESWPRPLKLWLAHHHYVLLKKK